MDGFSDRGSTPLRSIKKSLTGHSPVGLFFLYPSGRRTRNDESTLGFRQGRKVPVAPVMRRPSRQARLRLPSGPLKMDCVKTAEIPCLCGFPLFF